MSTLFGHLSSKFGPSTEDIGTEALCYLLRSSDEMMEAFIGHVNGLCKGDLSADMRIVANKSTEDGGRPDIVGWERQSSSRLFVESKFWAGLTSNQPSGYLQALEGDERSILLFLVPERRKQNVWRETLYRLDQNREASSASMPERFALQTEEGPSIAITTWGDVLDILSSSASDSGSQKIDEDIRQLRGLCQHEGADSFRPFTEGEFAASMAERIIDLHTLVKDLHDLVENRLEAWSTRQRARFAEHKYRFKAELYGYKAQVGVRYGWWRNEGISPFWLRLYFDHVEYQQAVFDALDLDVPLFEGGKYSPEDVLVPLRPPYGVGRDQIIEELLRQLDDIAERLAPVLADDI
jgi:hypothetical protein